jgi:uncharacterized membrane protein
MTVPSIPSLRQLKEYDERRPSFPGEHWLAFGAGLAVLMASRRSRSWVKRSVGSALGSALLYRAASGRDGLARVLPYLPVSGLGRR